jgi:[ribosomal protein S18]-alanine N-acetyltransferase
MSARVRPMAPTDIEAVIRIEKSALGSTWSVAAYTNELTNPAAFYVIAEDESGEPVGYGGVWIVMDEVHITALAVVPERRRQKIGESLLAAMLAEGLVRAATRATLEVRQSNVAAQKLYARYGFVAAAVRKRYYPDNHEDADILWLYDMTDPEWRTLFAENQTALWASPHAISPVASDRPFS